MGNFMAEIVLWNFENRLNGLIKQYKEQCRFCPGDRMAVGELMGAIAALNLLKNVVDEEREKARNARNKKEQ